MKKRSEAVPIVAEDPVEETRQEHGSGRSLTIYAVLLVIVVVLCIVLSYFIQNRNNRVIDTLNEQNISAQQKIENLQRTNVTLTEENGSLKTENQQLRDRVSELETEVQDVHAQWDADVAGVREAYEEKYNELWKLYKALADEKAAAESAAADETAGETAENTAATENEDGGTNHA